MLAHCTAILHRRGMAPVSPHGITGASSVTRYRYRGANIPTPWTPTATAAEHANRPGATRTPRPCPTKPQRYAGDHAEPQAATDLRWSVRCAQFWNPTRMLEDRPAARLFGPVARTVFRRVRLVGFSSGPALTECDGEGVDHRLPAHRLSGAAGPGWVQAAGDKVQTLQRYLALQVHGFPSQPRVPQPPYQIVAVAC